MNMRRFSIRVLMIVMPLFSSFLHAAGPASAGAADRDSQLKNYVQEIFTQKALHDNSSRYAEVRKELEVLVKAASAGAQANTQALVDACTAEQAKPLLELLLVQQEIMTWFAWNVARLRFVAYLVLEEFAAIHSKEGVPFFIITFLYPNAIFFGSNPKALEALPAELASSLSDMGRLCDRTNEKIRRLVTDGVSEEKGREALFWLEKFCPYARIDSGSLFLDIQDTLLEAFLKPLYDRCEAVVQKLNPELRLKDIPEFLPLTLILDIRQKFNQQYQENLLGLIQGEWDFDEDVFLSWLDYLVSSQLTSLYQNKAKFAATAQLYNYLRTKVGKNSWCSDDCDLNLATFSHLIRRLQGIPLGNSQVRPSERHQLPRDLRPINIREILESLKSLWDAYYLPDWQKHQRQYKKKSYVPKKIEKPEMPVAVTADDEAEAGPAEPAVAEVAPPVTGTVDKPQKLRKQKTPELSTTSVKTTDLVVEEDEHKIVVQYTQTLPPLPIAQNARTYQCVLELYKSSDAVSNRDDLGITAYDARTTQWFRDPAAALRTGNTLDTVLAADRSILIHTIPFEADPLVFAHGNRSIWDGNPRFSMPAFFQYRADGSSPIRLDGSFSVTFRKRIEGREIGRADFLCYHRTFEKNDSQAYSVTRNPTFDKRARPSSRRRIEGQAQYAE